MSGFVVICYFDDRQMDITRPDFSVWSGLKVLRSQGLKVSALDDRPTRGGGVRCPIGSTVTFDGSSDDLKSRRGDLKSSMRTRDLFWSHWGSMGGAWGSQGVKGSI